MPYIEIRDIKKDTLVTGSTSQKRSINGPLFRKIDSLIENYEDESSCQPWRGEIRRGKPVFTTRAGKRSIFRILYERRYGESPGNHRIRHRCQDNLCCNVNHWYLSKTAAVPETTRCDTSLKSFQIRRLRVAAELGVSHYELSLVFGLSPEKTKFYIEGIPDLRGVRKSDAYKLYREGRSHGQIAEIMGLSTVDFRELWNHDHKIDQKTGYILERKEAKG